MTCGGCAGAIRRAVTAVDPEAVVDASASTRRVQLTTKLSKNEVLTLLERIGHPAEVLQASR